MEKTSAAARQNWGAIVGAVLLSSLLVWAGGDHGISLAGFKVFGLCVALAFVIQWIAFIPAYLAKTEHYYDLVGGMTYILVTLIALLAGHPGDTRCALMAVMVWMWASRLATFLFLRVRSFGKDARFDEIKTNGLTYFMAWTLQGMWVSFTLAAVLAALTSRATVPLHPLDVIGVTLWLVGYIVEAIADRQKFRHKSDPLKKDTFIRTGLWAWSRHPNYAGEIILWVGMALLALPVLQGMQHLTLISPVFVYLLLTRVSGIPILERRAEKRWGRDSEYHAYKARTPLLFPSLIRKYER